MGTTFLAWIFELAGLSLDWSRDIAGCRDFDTLFGALKMVFVAFMVNFVMGGVGNNIAVRIHGMIAGLIAGYRRRWKNDGIYSWGFEL
ncbi:hypothetical protein ACFL31_00010 [Candidatus Margulisiibacteriota bacterium]